MLELIDVTKSYHKKTAVSHLSFQIESGDVLGLIGSNGAGKSTTISMIATLQKPDFGEILYKGENIFKKREDFRRKLGYVPQEIALYESLTGVDNLKFWGHAYHLSGGILKNAMKRVQELMGLSKEELSRKVQTYSGGMKRRLNIGVALLHEPEVVIMDEPTVGVDVVSRERILNMVEELGKRGIMVVYTGHYMEEIDRICNKICIMNLGQGVIFETKEKLLQKEQAGLEEILKKYIQN